MPITGKSFDSNTLTALARQAGPRVLSAIKTASAKTGVDFSYLLEKAAAESGFDTAAKSKSSSAGGLYQFIESTWLQMVKNHGHKYGLDRYADKIDENGRISDPAAKKEILDLRYNPEKAALLAAEFAADNKSYLTEHLDKDYGPIGSTELYMAHFLGAGSATAFLNASKKTPLTAAADLFPKAARANRNVFYDSSTGQPRTLAGVYDFFARKFGTDNDGGVPTEAPASAPPDLRVAEAEAAAAPTPDLVAQVKAHALQNQIFDLFSDKALSPFTSSATSATAPSLPLKPEAARLYPLAALRSFPRSGWQSPAGPSVAPTMLVTNPAALMLLAQMDVPAAAKNDR